MQGCVFLALVDIAAHWWIKLPQNPNFGAQIAICTKYLKGLYYQNYCINHNHISRVIETPRTLWVVQICLRQILAV